MSFFSARKLTLKIIASLIVPLQLPASPVYAQVDINPTSWPLARWTSLAGLVSGLIPSIMLIAGIIFFIMIVIAGFGMIAGAGSGDAHASEKAKNFLTFAVIGIIIIFASYWVLEIINYVTGGTLNGLFGK